MMFKDDPVAENNDQVQCTVTCLDSEWTGCYVHIKGLLFRTLKAPRLPIPKLEDTCNRYLDAQKPLLTPEQYEETKCLVEKFQKHEGPGTVLYY